MPLYDREAIVGTIDETYALMGRAIAADVPLQIVELAVRPDVVRGIALGEVSPYVTDDDEMLELLRTSYFELFDNVLRMHDELLNDGGERYERDLEALGLTGTGLSVKVYGFRRALGRLGGAPGRYWVKKAFQWSNVILGSLKGVPMVGVISDPLKELKESIEAAGED